MNTFMLLLYDNPRELATMSPTEMQSVIERYSAWAADLAAKGLHAGGNKLTDDGGRHISRQSQKISATDGPYMEAKEVVGGYFLIRANSLEEAERITRDCPHLDYGGHIELRKVDDIAS